jgi:hypothetical protein
MIAAHDAGFDRPYDPGADNSPPRCAYPKRVIETRKAGEPVRPVACGIDLLGPHCPGRDGCYEWQSIEECAHAEFVGMPLDRATQHHMPRELRGFDFVIIDEPSDRVFRPERDMILDLLDGHLFTNNPVLTDDGEEDKGATAEAKHMYALVRAVLDANSNGYWPIEALRAAGCEGDLFDGFVDLSDRRDRKTGMTAATSDEDRASIARTSFRSKVRKLCGFGRLAAQIMRGEEGVGLMELAGDAPRTVLMRPRAHLHSSLLSTRIMVTGAGLDLDKVRKWLPEAQPLSGNGKIPHAPHQTLVHIHKGAGKFAMRSELRQRWSKSFAVLEGEGETGIVSAKEHEHLFADLIQGVISGHHGGTAGLNKYKHCSTFFNFGTRFLSPVQAAAGGAADTGEPVPVKRPRQQMQRIALTGGGTLDLPMLEYEHPAARDANRAVRDFDLLQNPLGRPRAADRTAANPARVFNVGMYAPGGCEIDFAIRGAEDYAPDRMVIMAAESGLIVESSLGRHKLFPSIYRKPYTGQNDKQRGLEVGGFRATSLRIIIPAWRAAPRETWVQCRLWRSGHAHRDKGEQFFSTLRQLEFNQQCLRELYGATDFTIERWIYAAPSPEELSINPQSTS